jgi:hypothetical protein
MTPKTTHRERAPRTREVTKGKYVMVDPEELEAFQPRATRTVEIG